MGVAGSAQRWAALQVPPGSGPGRPAAAPPGASPCQPSKKPRAPESGTGVPEGRWRGSPRNGGRVGIRVKAKREEMSEILSPLLNPSPVMGMSRLANGKVSQLRDARCHVTSGHPLASVLPVTRDKLWVSAAWPLRQSV